MHKYASYTFSHSTNFSRASDEPKQLLLQLFCPGLIFTYSVANKKKLDPVKSDGIRGFFRKSFESFLFFYALNG